MNEKIKEMYLSTASCKIISDYYKIPLGRVKKIVKENFTQQEIEKIKLELTAKKAVLSRTKQKERYRTDAEYREARREYARNYWRKNYANLRDN